MTCAAAVPLVLHSQHGTTLGPESARSHMCSALFLARCLSLFGIMVSIEDIRAITRYQEHSVVRYSVSSP
jgi:hypothetical protein